MRTRISTFIAIVQSFLLVVHVALYATWAYFLGPFDPGCRISMQITLAILSVSFVAGSLLALSLIHI